MDIDMITVRVRVPRSMHSVLKEVSDFTGLTINQIVRKSLRKFHRVHGFDSDNVEKQKKLYLSTFKDNKADVVLNLEIPRELSCDSPVLRAILWDRVESFDLNAKDEALVIDNSDKKYIGQCLVKQEA